MAQITIDIPDANVAEIRDAFADTFGWTVTLGLTKTQFAKAQVAAFVKRVYREYKAGMAANTARNTAQTEVDQVIIT